jgi:ferredoxin-type protein NapH
MNTSINKLQLTRRIVQIAVILLILAVPAISRYANYLAARELDKNLVKWDGTLQGETLATIDTAFRTLPNAEKERVGKIARDRKQVLAYAQAYRGGPWSMQLGPLSMTDPLAGAESAIARKQIVPVLLTGLALPILLTLLFGRIFCSWICPVGFLLELTDKLRKPLRFLEIRPRNIQFSHTTKFILLAVGLTMTAILAVPVLAYIYPPAILNREVHDFVFALFDRAEIGKFGLSIEGLTWMSLLLLGIAIFEILISRRWWCRYLCPGGALYALLGIARPIRVKLKQQQCTRCADCIAACPMGLNPMENKMGIDCDNCGACISSCHDDALTYAFKITDKVTEPTTAPTEAVPVK